MILIFLRLRIVGNQLSYIFLYRICDNIQNQFIMASAIVQHLQHILRGATLLCCGDAIAGIILLGVQKHFRKTFCTQSFHGIAKTNDVDCLFFQNAV